MPQRTDEGLGPSTKLDQCPPGEGSGAKGLRVTADPKQLQQAESSVGFTSFPFLGQKDLLEKEMTTHSRFLAWRIP